MRYIAGKHTHTDYIAPAPLGNNIRETRLLLLLKAIIVCFIVMIKLRFQQPSVHFFNKLLY